MDDAQLFRMYQQDVYRVFANKVGGPSEVDDLMQTAFVRFFAADRSLVEDSKRYLLKVAHNVLREHWRRRAKPEFAGPLDDWSVADLATGASTHLGRNERHCIVLEGLRSLKSSQQAVLELHYWGGLKYREIAEILEVPSGTVGTLLLTGKRKLREYVEAQLDDGAAAFDLDASLRSGIAAAADRGSP